jgi:surface antigen
MAAPATVGQTLDFFRSQLGAHEDPPQSNCQKYSHFWKAPCQAWCADCTCYVLKHGNVLDVSYSAYTPTLAAGFKKAGRWGSTPKPGAVVFFDFIGRISHVGIVESVRGDGSIVTLEGNTDEAGGRTGGKVMRHVRKSSIVGYGYPEYAGGVKATAKAKATATGGAAPAWYKRILKDTGKKDHYMTGDDVKHVQTVVGAKPDGEYGPKTAARVKAWQTAHKVKPFDGEVGELTAKAMG